MVVSPLESLLERTVVGLGYGLADFEYINNGRMLRVFIEKIHEIEPDRAGVTLADCESVSRQLQRVFEVGKPVSQSGYGALQQGLKRAHDTHNPRA